MLAGFNSILPNSYTVSVSDNYFQCCFWKLLLSFARHSCVMCASNFTKALFELFLEIDNHLQILPIHRRVFWREAKNNIIEGMSSIILANNLIDLSATVPQFALGKWKNFNSVKYTINYISVIRFHFQRLLLMLVPFALFCWTVHSARLY